MLEISFPSREAWDGTREVVIFQASVGAKNIPCVISLEALRDHLNADLNQPLEAFRRHRPTIEGIDRRLIRDQRFEPDGSIVIRSQDR